MSGAFSSHHSLKVSLIVCLSWIVVLIVGPFVMFVFIVRVVAAPMMVTVVVFVVIVISVLLFLTLLFR